MLAHNVGSTEVAHCEPHDREGLPLAEPHVASVEIVKWQAEHGDNQKHLAKGIKNLEVCIDPIACPEPRVLKQRLLVLWDLDAQLGRESLSDRLSEPNVLLFEAWYFVQKRRNVVDAHHLFEGPGVFNVHETFVDLSSGEYLLGGIGVQERDMLAPIVRVVASVPSFAVVALANGVHGRTFEHCLFIFILF